MVLKAWLMVVMEGDDRLTVAVGSVKGVTRWCHPGGRFVTRSKQLRLCG
jgi:hypothetical protein